MLVRETFHKATRKATLTGRREQAHSAWRLPAQLGLVLSMVSLCLALLGYGHALAEETLFGVPEALFADSALDCVRLSSHVIALAVSRASDAMNAGFLVALYDKLQPLLWAATLLWAAALLGLRWSPLRRWLRIGAETVVRAVRHNLWLRTAANNVRAQAWPLVSLVGIWTAVPALLWMLTWALGMVAVLVAAVPLIGYEAGLRSLQTWVVEPRVCLQPRSRDSRMLAQDQNTSERSARPKAVTCVSILGGGGKELAQGRLVVATSRWAVLFDPVSGRVQRVPVHNAEITPIASLPAPAVSPGAASTTALVGTPAFP